MIKLKNILTEKKELGGAKIYQIDMATDRNHHNEARRLLAVVMGNKKLAKVYTAIEDLNMALGHLPPELSKLRMKMDKELFAQAKKTYSDYDIIKGVF
jgi:predicted SpoU family rRNA methylase